MFRYMNKNPKGNLVDDCSIRAISVAEDISWDEAYRKLSNLARQKGLMMDDAIVIESYLDSKYKRKNINNGMTVGEFMLNNTKGTFLVTMLGHITVIKDGFLYDVWDCSSRDVWSVWKVS